MTVAALFVRRDTHYARLGCDCYDIDRDATTFRGGSPAVAHPPCRGWSQLSHFAKCRPGEVDLAPWAVDMVRKHGGVVEHPYNSRLWSAVRCLGFGIRDDFGGVLIPLYQNWFGHRAYKKTAIYVVGPLPVFPALPELAPVTTVQRMGRAERERTPEAFATWLVDIARSCSAGGAL